MKTLSLLKVLFVLLVIPTIVQIVESASITKPADLKASAHPSTDSAISRISLGISTLDSLRSGQFDTLNITLKSTDHIVAGFSLKIASSNEQLQIVQITSGELLDSCGWELFNATPIVQEINRPQAVWRISGLAKMSADTVVPECLAHGNRVTIARIIVTSGAAGSSSEPMPIFFFWEDCRDNTVSDEGGRQLFVSERVIDYVPVAFPESTRSFPNRTGAPPSCVSPKVANAPRRLIEFHNGGVLNTRPENK